MTSDFNPFSYSSLLRSIRKMVRPGESEYFKEKYRKEKPFIEEDYKKLPWWIQSFVEYPADPEEDSGKAYGFLLAIMIILSIVLIILVILRY